MECNQFSILSREALLISKCICFKTMRRFINFQSLWNQCGSVRHKLILFFTPVSYQPIKHFCSGGILRPIQIKQYFQKFQSIINRNPFAQDAALGLFLSPPPFFFPLTERCMKQSGEITSALGHSKTDDAAWVGKREGNRTALTSKNKTKQTELLKYPFKT